MVMMTDNTTPRRERNTENDDEDASHFEKRPLLGYVGEHAGREGPGDDQKRGGKKESLRGRHSAWIVYALASGACAAFNGVFAKLTTTELTSTFSRAIAQLLRLDNLENIIEVVVRLVFFGLNIFFNGVMWSLFTTALTRAHSTAQVSILNTSSNFVVTALAGMAIFSEHLPTMWWLGAALLVVGNVITGGKDEATSVASFGGTDAEWMVVLTPEPEDVRVGEEEGDDFEDGAEDDGEEDIDSDSDSNSDL